MWTGNREKYHDHMNQCDSISRMMQKQVRKMLKVEAFVPYVASFNLFTSTVHTTSVIVYITGTKIVQVMFFSTKLDSE